MAGNERARIARVLRGHAEASITRVGGPVTRDRAWSVTPRGVSCVWEEECERFPGRSHSCEMGGYAGGGAASDPGHRPGVSLDRRCGVLTSEAFSHLGWSRSSSRHYEDDWPWWAGGSGTPDPYGAVVPPERGSQMPDRGCVARTCRGDPCVARCAFRRGTPRRRVSAASAIRTAESASPRHRIAGPLSRRVGQRPTPTGG